MPQITDDPNHPNVKRGAADITPVPQHDTYLVLSEEERQKGFVRPFRDTYQHLGQTPKFPLRDLTEEEKVRHAGSEYSKFEEYPESESLLTGHYWTEASLKKGCGAITTMGRALSETYARDPRFYGQTYCVGCHMHRPVAEFRWTADGTVVGS